MVARGLAGRRVVFARAHGRGAGLEVGPRGVGGGVLGPHHGRDEVPEERPRLAHDAAVRRLVHPLEGRREELRELGRQRAVHAARVVAPAPVDLPEEPEHGQHERLAVARDAVRVAPRAARELARKHVDDGQERRLRLGQGLEAAVGRVEHVADARARPARAHLRPAPAARLVGRRVAAPARRRVHRVRRHDDEEVARGREGGQRVDDEPLDRVVRLRHREHVDPDAQVGQRRARELGRGPHGAAHGRVVLALGVGLAVGHPLVAQEHGHVAARRGRARGRDAVEEHQLAPVPQHLVEVAPRAQGPEPHEDISRYSREVVLELGDALARGRDLLAHRDGALELEPRLLLERRARGQRAPHEQRQRQQRGDGDGRVLQLAVVFPSGVLAGRPGRLGREDAHAHRAAPILKRVHEGRVAGLDDVPHRDRALGPAFVGPVGDDHVDARPHAGRVERYSRRFKGDVRLGGRGRDPDGPAERVLGERHFVARLEAARRRLGLGPLRGVGARPHEDARRGARARRYARPPAEALSVGVRAVVGPEQAAVGRARRAALVRPVEVEGHAALDEAAVLAAGLLARRGLGHDGARRREHAERVAVAVAVLEALDVERVRAVGLRRQVAQRDAADRFPEPAADVREEPVVRRVARPLEPAVPLLRPLALARVAQDVARRAGVPRDGC
mmetsp:Transcript_20459/g.60998  ORF Transcript_20459/g.60998 Transcript_20459/m.60998 type:complete len:676 (-) Transcript_20459:638-2665(-)